MVKIYLIFGHLAIKKAFKKITCLYLKYFSEIFAQQRFQRVDQYPILTKLRCLSSV